MRLKRTQARQPPAPDACLEHARVGQQPAARRRRAERPHAAPDRAGPSRNRAAKNASAIARTNSPSAEQSGGGRAGGSAISTARPTNQPRNTSTRARSRRSHPRTVVSGNPSAPAIGRYPRPSAAIPTAHPITSTASSRRANKNPGSSAACAHTPAPRPPDQQPKPGPADPYPPPIPTPRSQPAGARRTPHPPGSDGPTPARNIGPTHRRGTATINTGICQRAPPISPKMGALFTFKDTRSLARPTSLRRQPPLPCRTRDRRRPRRCRTSMTQNGRDAELK